MKLYYAPGACSLSPHIVAREAGLPLQLVRVDTKTHRIEGDRDFYDVNPRGYVPVLQLDDGALLREGSAIVQFLADMPPHARLIPVAGTMDRVRAQEWLNFIATEFHKQFIWLLKGAPEEVLIVQRGKVGKVLAELDQHLGVREYILGDHFSVVDAYAFAITNWCNSEKVRVRSRTLRGRPWLPGARCRTACGARRVESRRAGVMRGSRKLMLTGVHAACCATALAVAMPPAQAMEYQSASDSLVLGQPAPPSTPSSNGVPALVGELGLEETEQRVDQRAGWRRPSKIVIRAEKFVGFPGVEWLQPAAPGVRLVAVDNVEDAIEQAHDADAVIGWCDAKILDAGPRIRWIQFFYAGVDSCVAIPTVRERDVLLTNMQRVQSSIIAEHTIAMVLALARGLDLAVAQQSAREWRPDTILRSERMRVLKGKTLLVAGLGGIGTEVARRAHALGMRVIATRASDRTGPEFVSYVGLPDELPKLAAEADVVVDALPLTPATRGTFDARLFAAMKRSALFVNVGRGGTVDTTALVRALQSGALGGAGLDVTDPEPLPAEHPLWQAPNVIITPHISSESQLGFTRVWEIVRENLRRYVAGEKMLSVVDVARGY